MDEQYYDDAPRDNAGVSARHAAVEQPPKIPLKGLAMVLIAVAVLLVAWGFYAVRQSGSQEATAPTTSITTSARPAPRAAAPSTQAPAATTAGSPVSSAAATVPATGVSQPPAAPAPSQPSSAAPAPGVAAVHAVEVHVLNNSTIGGLAGRQADSLRGAGWTNVSAGNLPGIALPTTTVFFAPDNPVEKAAADELAHRFGGVAQPKDAVHVNLPAGVVVALVKR